MLRIIASFYIDPKERENFFDIVRPLIENTRKEAGCIFYSLFEDVNSPNCFTFIEQWADNEAIELHGKTLHLTEAITKIKEISIKEPQINIYSEVLI